MELGNELIQLKILGNEYYCVNYVFCYEQNLIYNHFSFVILAIVIMNFKFILHCIESSHTILFRS